MENNKPENEVEILDELTRYVFVCKTLSAIMARPDKYKYDDLLTIKDGNFEQSEKFSEFLSSILK